MIQKILTVPNPLLRQKSQSVGKIDKKIKKLVNDLIETAQSAREPKGVGLSAVQIGKLARVFIIKQKGVFVPFINPQVIWQSKKTLAKILAERDQFLEGCLSLPSYYGFVDRPYEVKLTWQDLEGQRHQKKFTDKESVYLQHELDHLNGILFVDRLLAQKGKLYKLEKDKNNEEIFREVEFLA